MCRESKKSGLRVDGLRTNTMTRCVPMRRFFSYFKVGRMMEEMGTRFIHGFPKKISKTSKGKLLVRL